MMGYVLATSGMNENKHVTYLPSYGAEVRGGTANCTVTVSDEPIALPFIVEDSTTQVTPAQMQEMQKIFSFPDLFYLHG